MTCRLCGSEVDPDDLIDGVCYDCAHDELIEVRSSGAEGDVA